jgi:hypothetical protein
MKTLLSYLPLASLLVGGWAIVNGILHDVFVLASEHGKKYDRDLLRLLQDGHILITCGVMQMLAYKGFQTNASWAYYVSGAACISMLIYCGMIFPFLKSIVTILINLGLLSFILISYWGVFRNS